MLRGKKASLGRIVEAFPDIMRSLAPRRPVTDGAMELTIAQMRALHVVEDSGVCTMGKLARELGISLSSATGLADRLVERGFAEREAAANDRRVVRLRLAPAGKHARSLFRKAVLRRLSLAEQRLSVQELAQIADSIELLRGALAGSRQGSQER